jgi:chemotaxis protein CheD
MKIAVVGIGEMEVSDQAENLLRTFALGSCIGVVMLAPYLNKRFVAGLLHVALPDSSINRLLALERPGYFADTGIPILIEKMLAYGLRDKDLIVKIAGGANIMDPDNRFKIGTKNVLAVKKLLQGYGLQPVVEDVGGSISRTVTVAVNSGRVLVTSPGSGKWEL